MGIHLAAVAPGGGLFPQAWRLEMRVDGCRWGGVSEFCALTSVLLSVQIGRDKLVAVWNGQKQRAAAEAAWALAAVK